MSKLSDKKLEELFRDKLHDLEKNPSPEGWSLLSKDLVRQNFLSFGWKHFNIYQVLFFSLLSIVGTLYFLKPDAISSDPTLKKGNSVAPEKTLLSDSLLNRSTLDSTLSPLGDKPIEKIQVKIKKTSKEKPLKDLSTNLKNVPDSLVPSRIPTEETPIQNVIPEVKKAEVQKPKKVITIVKRDTLIVKDTINIKKKRKTK